MRCPRITALLAVDTTPRWLYGHTLLQTEAGHEEREMARVSERIASLLLAANTVKEFKAAMQLYLNARFRSGKISDRKDRDCWGANHQATCLFAKNPGTLWIIAPIQAILNGVLAQYPDFP